MKIDMHKETATDFIACDSYTGEIQTATVEVVTSDLYSIKVGTSWIQMSRKHLMETITDMDERRTYEVRLADVQLRISTLNPAATIKGSIPEYVKDLMGDVWKLSDDINWYVEARGEDLEEELEEPIIEARMDLADLGYPLTPEDEDMAKWIKECEAKRDAHKGEGEGLGDIGEGSEQ